MNEHDYDEAAHRRASLVPPEDESAAERGEQKPDPPSTHERIFAVIESTGSTDPGSIAEALIDDDVSSGEYEGCSTEMEIAASEYIAAAERELALRASAREAREADEARHERARAETDDPEAAHYAALDAEETERGPAAGLPVTLPCYACHPVPGEGIERKVVAPGPVVEERRDPTQTYRLECGHGAI